MFQLPCAYPQSSTETLLSSYEHRRQLINFGFLSYYVAENSLSVSLDLCCLYHLSMMVESLIGGMQLCRFRFMVVRRWRAKAR